MSFHVKAAGFCLGLAISAIGFAGSASAQYRSYDPDPNYGRSDRYERRDGYDRRDGYGRRGDWRDNRGYDQGGRGYGQDGRGYGQRQGAGPGRGNNPMAGMSLEDQKRAIKNHREAQKKAIKRGYVIP